ncbi:S41 family peptidase [Niabella sp. 22666]|uniref:S41 family peptidase n=1 Tax=Niabella sp. 22666 TaxID=3453954 RepID=UPI003F844DB7
MNAGWVYTKNSSVITFNSDKKDSLQIDYLDIKADTGRTIVSKIFNIPRVDSGMIKIEVFIDNVSSQSDSISPAIFIHARKNSNIVVLKGPEVINLLGGKRSGIVKLHIPFDQPIDNLYLGFVAPPHSRLTCSNYNVEITQGEFSKEWLTTHSLQPVITLDFIDNLQFLGKLWGYLKYFSPKISKENIDWDKILIDNIDTLFMNNSKQNFVSVLTKIIDTATYKNSCLLKSNPMLDSASAIEKMNIDYTWITKNNLLNKKWKEQLLFLSKCYQYFENDYVKTPIETGKSSPQFIENSYDRNALPEYRFRLLSLFRYWNVIDYYYPYKYLIKEKWKNILIDFIPEFIKANTTRKYEKALIKLNASIEDGHASNVGGKMFQIPSILLNSRFNVLPVKFFVLDNKIYAAKTDSIFSKTSGLNPGDEIASINGYRAKWLIDTIRSGISYHRDEMKDHVINQLNLLTFTPISGDSITIVFYSGGREKRFSERVDTAYHKRYSIRNILYPSQDNQSHKAYRVINDSILYLNVQEWKKSDSSLTKELLQKTNNVIIDCRYYPNWDFISFSSVFFKDNTDIIKFLRVERYPGLTQEITNQSLPNGNFIYNGNIMVLMSEASLSRPEMFIMYLKSIKGNIQFVGRTSAGADGDITSIPMIGRNDMTFIYSGLGVFFPDNKPTQGIGIEPDICIKRTIKEYLYNEDVILNKAIELISNDHRKINK